MAPPDTRGRTELYRTWVDDHGDELYRFAYRLCGRRHLAEDLVQETFTEAWRSLAKLRDVNKARAWLYQILRHRWAHWVRDTGRRLRPQGDVESLDPAGPDEGESTLRRMSREEILQRALDELDERYRETFLMVFQQGLTCRETARLMDIPLGTVLSRVHRARGRLRERIRALDPSMSSLDTNDDDDSEGGEDILRLGGTA